MPGGMRATTRTGSSQASGGYGHGSTRKGSEACTAACTASVLFSIADGGMRTPRGERAPWKKQPPTRRTGMEHVSECFNKRSRLVRGHAVQDPARPLHRGDPGTLEARLASLLRIQNDFFPCFDWTFPPPLLTKQSPPASAEALFSGTSILPGRYSIYLHSPFCKTLCNFCYYAVLPGKGIQRAETYVDYLLREMALYADVLADAECESVYFGGGTPTFLDDGLLSRIFEGLHRYFRIDPAAEITIEAAPGTLGRDKLAHLQSLGVNRLSYGIQTLDEALLAGMNRHYRVAEAERELVAAVEVIGNVNVDTMYGFDGEREDTLPATLERFVELGVPSVSIYALDKQRSQTKQNFEPPKDALYEYKIRQFARAEALLRDRGFRPVLQNVFLDPDRASYIHQVRRWDNLPLLGLGLNSQGYAPATPYQNLGSLKLYCEAIDAGRIPVSTMERLDRELDFCRELTSKLRFTQVSRAELHFKYGVDIDEVFGDLTRALEGLGFVERAGELLRMTPKAAYYNNIIPMLYAPDAFKERLTGLPEEYIERFPVPYVLTGLGACQSAPFRFRDRPRERRLHADRRRGRAEGHAPAQERRAGPGRRATDHAGLRIAA
ncbi:MAG: radical SAM protein [Gammaproteobacteria bacterium]|nr:MAG: radical SAM protein [Gammaproteobacteria bacterium]